MSIEKNNILFPDYMDVPFFEDIVKSSTKDKSAVLEHVKFTRGHKPGENYCSVIYRVNVTYSTSTTPSTTIPLIIKTQVLNDDYKTADFFGKEADIYNIALPKIQSILGGVQIAPRVYYSTRKPTDIIVFHDMTPEGYLVADRIKGLDEEHCAMVLRKLAKLHAASMELARLHPKSLKTFEVGMINDDSEKFVKTVLHYNILDFAKLIETWPGYEEIAKKFMALSENTFGHFKMANYPREGELKVLTHNDLWTNNILFKYDETKKLIDTLLIDFQASFYCSPGIDIAHFLYTTPENHLLATKRDYMIEEYYYATFKSTLEKIGYFPIPTLEGILREIDQREMSGFLWSVVKLFLICMDHDDCGEDNSIDSIGDPEIGGKLREKGMSSPRFQATMKYMLKRLDKLGKL